MLKFRADVGDGEVIVPVREVTGRVLRQVLEYCEMHARHDAASSACGDEAARERLRKEIEEWDARFIDVDLSAFYDLLMAGGGPSRPSCARISSLVW
ncbi:E3 ubiquitin ligase complex SCF subunit sconC-like isoform X1 [Ananas comosus]|uniref:E3 ubiquitin ligase complex SCF subunit sconC-like isoform X1 n=1 Tax=Ananas comosus TaxID=4615 RepID=A0A6P5FMK6_ANACO|nr:E3 ubiquitin ligase complex SCF subunit sconC-like isoform X1 [Ananas comosus]